MVVESVGSNISQSVRSQACAWGSQAVRLRTYLICLCILIFPLLHSLFIYIIEYHPYKVCKCYTYCTGTGHRISDHSRSLEKSGYSQEYDPEPWNNSQGSWKQRGLGEIKRVSVTARLGVCSNATQILLISNKKYDIR